MNQVHQAVEQISTFKSRWGYHPCDYATYLLLKKLAQYERRAYAQYRTWQRWKRKAPQNRVHKEYLRNDKNQRIGTKIIGPSTEPQWASTYWLDGNGRFVRIGAVRDYDNARTPRNTPAEVRGLSLSQANIKHAIETLAQ